MNAFPAIPGLGRLVQDVEILVRVEALVRRHWFVRESGHQLPARCRPIAELENPAPSLACIGERLALAELDVEEPLPRPRFRQSYRSPLAVVEDVRGLVDDEILKSVLLLEIPCRDVAGCLLAEPDTPARVELTQVRIRDRLADLAIELTEAERLLICVALDRFAQENEGFAELGGAAMTKLVSSAAAARVLIQKLQGAFDGHSFLDDVRHRTSEPW